MVSNGLYSRVAARLNDWLNVSSVSVENGNLALDLINRGQERLEQEADWEPLIKIVALTVDPITRTATLPSDLGKVIRVYFDPLGYGKGYGYYAKDGDLIYGYKELDTVSKSAAIVRTVTFFFATPLYIPQLVYTAELPRFTGQGQEYTFFPETLLLRAAQMEHIADNPIGALEVQLIEKEYEKAKFNFKKRTIGVNADYRNTIKDWSGNQIQVPGYSSDGGVVSQRSFSPSFDNSYGSQTN